MPEQLSIRSKKIYSVRPCSCSIRKPIDLHCEHLARSCSWKCHLDNHTGIKRILSQLFSNSSYLELNASIDLAGAN